MTLRSQGQELVEPGCLASAAAAGGGDPNRGKSWGASREDTNGTWALSLVAGWALGEVRAGRTLQGSPQKALGGGGCPQRVGGGKGGDQLPRRRERAEDGEWVVSVLGRWAFGFLLMH